MLQPTLPESLRHPLSLALNQLRERLGEARWLALPAPVQDTLEPVWAVSSFIASQCIRQPDHLLHLVDSGRLLSATRTADDYRQLLCELTGAVQTETDWMRVLRQFRNREMIRIAWRDIADWASLEDTLQELSWLAETCIDASLAFLFRQAELRGPVPLDQAGQPQSLLVLGMGKLGAFELNFSSDIDLIFGYRNDGLLPDRNQTPYSEFYARLARSLVKVLDARTEDGFVFRVDTRLRPFGDSGPLVMSLEAMDIYYQGQAREWERYAMVKARVVAGDRAGGAELDAIIRPFVYRRYLDYRALGELRGLKQKITRELQRRDRLDNIKLGPGGIREIEFIGQAFQLIRGGQEPRLRRRDILGVLTTLGELELLPMALVSTLTDAYRCLRRVENRLQQQADAQTHDLPTDPLQRASLAFALGYPDWDSAKQAIDAVRQPVHAAFHQVIEAGSGDADTSFGLAEDEASNRARLETLNWPEADAAARLLTHFAAGSALRQATPRAITEINRLLPALLRLMAASGQPTQSLEPLLGLLESIAGRTVYLSLLAENTPVLALLVKMAIGGPWIIHYIARHPLLLDELLDTRRLYTPLSKTGLAQELERRLAACDADDTEQVLITLRQFKQANVLRVAAADLVEAIPVMVVSDYLTWIAEVLIETVVTWAWRITAQRHGVPPGTCPETPGRFGVIAYGKLGGIELSYSSDLDLVFLYEGDDADPTDGDTPIATADFFTRLGRRIIHLVTANTPYGILYDIDLRLRPSGASGLLVSNLTAYETYQMTQAWTWEQQALVKARFITGDAAVARAFERIRNRSLSRARDRETLRQEVVTMREKMRETLLPRTQTVFPLKQGIGGIVDIEFLVQFGVLSGARDHAELTVWTDVVRLLEALARSGFLTADAADFLKLAYCTLRERVHRAALQAVAADVPITEYLDLRTRVSQLWQLIMGGESPSLPLSPTFGD